MKRILLISLAVVLAISVGVVGCDGTGNGNGNGEIPQLPTTPITLKVANYFPAPAFHSVYLEMFCEELEERSGGKLNVDYYPASTLLGPTDMFDGVVDGTAHIGYSHVYYTPGVFPVTETVGLPLGYPSAWVGSQVVNDFYREFTPPEFDDVVVLWMNTSNPNVIITTTPVNTLGDLSGLQIRGPGRVGDTLTALGATPTPTAMPDVYAAMQAGDIDGCNTPFETLLSFKLAEVATHVTASWQVGNCFPFFLVMNQAKYDEIAQYSLLRAIFHEVVGEWTEHWMLMWNAIDFHGLEYALDEGVTIIELSPAEAANWQAAVAPVLTAYVTEMEGKGYTAAQVQGWITFLQDRIDYWTTKQIELRITSPTGPPGMRP